MKHEGVMAHQERYAKRQNRLLRRGDRVLIFEDPLTETKAEGWALVRAVVSVDKNSSAWRQRVRVRFFGDDESVERWVYGKAIVLDWEPGGTTAAGATPPCGE